MNNNEEKINVWLHGDPRQQHILCKIYNSQNCVHDYFCFFEERGKKINNYSW